VSAHVFVDETQERGYLIAAAAVLPGGLPAARQTMRSLILPRQRRIHFFKESDARRKQILSVIIGLAPQVVMYDASSHRTAKTARPACLAALVKDLAAMNAARLVLELDESVVAVDKKVLYREIHAQGVNAELRYDHLRAAQECLLSIPGRGRLVLVTRRAVERAGAAGDHRRTAGMKTTC
jgi:hypothetical protein